MLKRTHGALIQRVITEIYQSPTSFALASEIAEELANTKQYDKAHIVYNRFKSAIAYDTLVDEVDSAGQAPPTLPQDPGPETRNPKPESIRRPDLRKRLGVSRV